MKNRRLLHETDLARIALLTRDEKVRKLEVIGDFVPNFSWSPFKECLPGIFQAKKPLMDLPDVSWNEIDAAIRRLCKRHLNWLEDNLQIAKIASTYVNFAPLRAREWSFGALPVGHGASVKFWPDFYYIEDQHPTITYVDPRRGHGITGQAKKFVFSAMHHRIAHTDFSQARLRIMQFPVDRKTNERSIHFRDMSEADLVDIDTMNLMIQETYELWYEILERRERQARRKTGTDDQ